LNFVLIPLTPERRKKMYQRGD